MTYPSVDDRDLLPALGTGRLLCAAADLGAESGRVFLGAFDGARVSLSEASRFANEPVDTPDGLCWDTSALLSGVAHALAETVANGESIISVGVDAWGVDFALIDDAGTQLGLPRNYRDASGEAGLADVLGRFSASELYDLTGVQLMAINTLFQLAVRRGDPDRAHAKRLLLIPDLINYLLTGEQRAEQTIASTTQMIELATGDWSPALCEHLGLQSDLLAPVVSPGETLGRLRSDVAASMSLPDDLIVCTVASHDTASAVVGTPLSGAGSAFISSGTWSLVGVEIDEPVVSLEACELNFGNERGFGGKTRFLRNVMGLWLLQECRRAWRLERDDASYQMLADLAAAEPEAGPVIDPDWPEFLRRGNMPELIREACARTDQAVPRSRGSIARCILESLACKYRLRIDQLEALTGERIETIHIVGGGSGNGLLCQLTADASGRDVVAGPAEAAAVGNILVQLHAHGELGSLAEMREITSRSFRSRRYTPRAGRSDLYERFLEVVAKRDSTNIEITLES